MTLKPSFNTVFCRPDFFKRWFYCWKLRSSHLTSLLGFVHENIYYVPSVLLIDADPFWMKESWDDPPCMTEAGPLGQHLVLNKPRLRAWPDRLSLSPHSAHSASLPLPLSGSLCPQGFSTRTSAPSPSCGFYTETHTYQGLSLILLTPATPQPSAFSPFSKPICWNQANVLHICISESSRSFCHRRYIGVNLC